jgi:phospholipase/carboxylesterase
VFIGCSDVDAHIPIARVQETTSILQQLGAVVTERIYPGMEHTIIQDEIDHALHLVEQIRPSANNPG